MINGAMVIVECDICCTTEYIDLVQTEAGIWEERGLRNELEDMGWYTDWDDSHFCPNCKLTINIGEEA